MIEVDKCRGLDAQRILHRCHRVGASDRACVQNESHPAMASHVAKALICQVVKPRSEGLCTVRFAFHKKLAREKMSKHLASQWAQRLLYHRLGAGKSLPREPLQRLSPSWPG